MERRTTSQNVPRDAVLAGVVAILVAVAIGASARGRRPTSVVPKPEAEAPWTRRSLAPVRDLDPSRRPQPVRLRPYRVATHLDGRKAYVTLPGMEAAPGESVAVLDVERFREIGRIPVGRAPYGIAVHPSGQWVLVTNRLSNFISIIDTTTDIVTGEIPVPSYCDDLVIAPDGRTAYAANFWKNQVLVIDLDDDGERLRGSMRELGFDRAGFCAEAERPQSVLQRCPLCGWQTEAEGRCRVVATRTSTRSSPRREPDVPAALCMPRCARAAGTVAATCTPPSWWMR